MFSSAFKSFTSNITSNYEISKQPSANVGVWNIFEAKKRSTGTQVSVFVFDRKVLDVASTASFGAKTSSTSVRKAQDEVVDRLKKEASLLARLRHPSVLQLIEPVEETRNGGLMFATELVLASLSAALSQKDRGSTHARRNESNSKTIHNVDVDELEIQKGVLQIARGLEFLHDSAKLVHGNLTPDAIFINAKSDWKLSGLAFAGPPDNAEGHQTLPQLSLAEALHDDPRIPSSVQLNLDYSSPDFVIDSNVNYSADIYSLGMVLVACYREPHSSPFETHGNTSTYKRIMASPSLTPGPRNNFGCTNKLPNELENTLVRVLAKRPSDRMTAVEFQQSEYFDNILVNTMRFLDGLPAKTSAEKQQFMRGLARVMPQFPVSVLEKKILSVLLEEMKDKDLLSVILQNIFQIVKMVPGRREVLSTNVLPKLKEVFTAQAKSQERDTSKEAGLMVFLEHIKIISDNTSAQQFKEDALPIVHVAMQSTIHSLVDAALGTLATILPVLDFSTVKHDLFPVIANVFAKTSSLGIKTRGLEAIAVLCGANDETSAAGGDDLSGIASRGEEHKKNLSMLDKFTMQEKVMPLLKGIKTKEPAVMMTALKVFRQIAKAGDVDFLATELMPILWTFALGPLLDLSQFNAYMDVIQALTQKIQREQVKKLQELATVNRTVADSRERASVTSYTGQASNHVNGTGDEVNFEKLVLGSRTKEQKDLFGGALDDEQKLVQNPASYSWQTSSGRATPSQRMATLQPSQSQSRSVTPDVSASSFPSLQPTDSTSIWSQPLQPGPRPSVAAANSWTTPSTMQPIVPAQNMWNQPLKPQANMGASNMQATSYLSTPTTSNLYNATVRNTSSIPAPLLAPPPQSPPPINSWQHRGSSQQVSAIKPQPSKPAGLDKYQSLL
ncbi:Protein kinase domain-containing protein ppk32 [Lithohypha guttulata]|uniref:Protein kinase domain-containing protein ppk32 n=1 Tax=Lithohypha guttulata TaxID=1690604 RepID=UPI002DDE367E|nr:Protein kinase domain-containing protein ppk32 [Lithohypha guttulata]